MPPRSRPACALALLLSRLLVAAEPAALPDGTAPWGDRPASRADLAAPAPGCGSLRLVPAEADTPGGPDAVVLELTTTRTAPTAWALQASIPSLAPIAKGDAIVVECWLRTAASGAESGEARTSIQIEHRGSPWSKIISRDLAAGADGRWSRRTCAGIAGEDYAAGAAQINFHMGYAKPQTLQIAGLRLIGLGPGIDLRTLPVQRATYAGMEPDAPWRAAAAERIECIRKGDLRIAVVDGAGAPLAGAQVHVEMLRHAFPFGAAVVPNRLLANGPDGEKYRAWVLANCSRVVLENQLKWNGWEDGAKPDAKPWDQRETTLKALGWLNEHGIAVRGHCLIWPSWSCSPARPKPLATDAAALRAACDAHISEILTATAPYQLAEWDVVNENFANHDLTDLLGQDEVAHWFARARSAFPVGGLVYNDYAHLRGGDHRHEAFVEDLVLRLKQAGAPVTALGIQSHFGGPATGPAAVVAELDRLAAKLDVDLAITEFDIAPTDRDEELQAAYTRDFLTACFSHPRVNQFIAWGFWAGAHWSENAAMIRRDWTPKPAATVWNDLVRTAWWTDTTLATDAAGSGTVRGFKGCYRITVTAAGRTTTCETDIGDQPTTLRIAAPPSAKTPDTRTP